MGTGGDRGDIDRDIGIRRPLVLLFTDIANSTALASMMEPEDYADLLTALRTVLQVVMEKYDGQIIRLDGDGALCIFGLSRGAVHAGRQAAMAALSFHAEVASVARARGLDVLAMHSGIHAGLVLLRAGDLVRGRYEVIGDATNIAARLCDAADADDILVSGEALGSDAQHFVLGARTDVPLRAGGKQTERRIAAYTVHGLMEAQGGTNNKIGLDKRPIFGRETELALAKTWLNQSAMDAPIFFIRAEAGGGKSRLLAAISDLAEERGLLVVHGQCEDDYLAAALQPMEQLTSNLGSKVAQFADIWAKQEAMRSTIVKSAQGRPVLMVIDDWQWADDATKRLVEQAMATAKGHIRLLVASRTDDAEIQGRKPEWTIGLPPLTSSDASLMVGNLLPHFDPQKAPKIHILSGGNPLLIEELCRDPECVEGNLHDSKVSFRVAAVVERRVAALPSEAVNWLEHISVCVGGLPIWVLATLVDYPLDAIETMAQALSKTDFIHQDVSSAPHETIIRYRHVLLKKAVQDRMSPARRRMLHRKIADFLMSRANPSCIPGRKEKLAHHLLSSNNSKGLEYALAAGKAATRAGSIDRALGQYRRSIEFVHHHRFARDEVTILCLANRFGAAVLLDPHLEHFGPLNQLHAIADQQGLTSIKGRLLYWGASLHYATGRPDEAQSVLDLPDFTEMFEGAGLPKELVTALHGQLDILKGRHRRAAVQLNTAISGLEARANPAYDASITYMVLMRAQMLGEQGFFEQAANDFERAEQLMQGKDVPLYASFYTQRAGVALWAENYPKVREFAAAGLHHGERIGSRYYAMLSRALDAVARGHIDKKEEALAELERCLRWSTHAQSGYTLSLIYSWAAELALRLGDTVRAADYAHSCITQGRHQLFWGAAEAWRVRAALASDKVMAMRALRHSYAHARRMGSIRDWTATTAAHSAACARFGDVGRAGELQNLAAMMRGAIGLPATRLRLVSETDAQPDVAMLRASAL